MRNRIFIIPIVSASLLSATAAMAQGSSTAGSTSPAASTAAPRDHAPAMDKLQKAAQHLRESIQAMAQKRPGGERDRAIDQAHEALLETHAAMVALPPDLRGSGALPEPDRTRPSQRRGATAASDADYERSVAQLMRASDSLRQSIQAMAQQPAGQRRNQAMEQARQALWDSQQAMVAAYDPSAARAARTMGAQARSAGGDSQQAAAQRMRTDRN